MHSFVTSLLAPTVEEFNPGHCFRVKWVGRRALCRWIAKIPGATFTREPGLFSSWSSVEAEFVLRGQAFQIEADPWEGGWRIVPQDRLAHPEEIREIRQYVEGMGNAGAPG